MEIARGSEENPGATDSTTAELSDDRRERNATGGPESDVGHHGGTTSSEEMK
ncbi:hypothetical protein [Brevibacterium siliguriense]|uniref:hypothetical protein n=1 Tax=Brevibacterium siliguriense TaxID=1136497 RepID=UPI000B19CBB0|nr:hypothetical protein [Brevibacterium siliguriense]